MLRSTGLADVIPGANRNGCPAPDYDLARCVCRHAPWRTMQAPLPWSYCWRPAVPRAVPSRCRNGHLCPGPRPDRSPAVPSPPLLPRYVAGRTFPDAGWGPLMTLRTPDPGRLTPAAVRSMSFRVARMGRRGLDEDDVQDFCERVEDELARLLEERSRLYAEVRRLRGPAPAGNRAGTVPAMPLSAPVAASPRALPPAGGARAGSQGPRESDQQALRVLAKAQQTAERCVADAQAYSREVAHDAQRRREKILAEASARASVLLEQAHRAGIRAALGRPGPDPGQLPSAAPASYRDPVSYPDPLPYRDQAASYPEPASYPEGTDYSRPADYPGSADYSGARDTPGAAADYPGPAGDYPGNPARYRDTTGRRRIPVKYDRFPF